MKALVISKINDLSSCREPLDLIDLPDPQPSGSDIIIKVKACGVCHTELDEIEGRTPPEKFPMIPGHEVIGKGYIGEELFRNLMNDERFLNKPGFLEIPGGEVTFKKCLEKLKGFRKSR